MSPNVWGLCNFHVNWLHVHKFDLCAGDGMTMLMAPSPVHQTCMGACVCMCALVVSLKIQNTGGLPHLIINCVFLSLFWLFITNVKFIRQHH